MKNFKFDYDPENDDLLVYLENEKSSGGIEAGNFVFDFNNEGEFVGMEILDASETLSNLLSKIIELNNIKEVKVFKNSILLA